MAEFHRRLPKKSVDRLKELTSARTGWWPDLLSSWAPSGSPGALRLAVRDRYVNLYALGQSIAKISFGPGGVSPTMFIHEKYVKKCPGNEQKYFKLPCDKGDDAEGKDVPWDGRGMLDAWIARSRCHTSEEKRYVEALVAVSPRVIDLEMGLPAFGTRKSALRMDIVALEGSPDSLRLVFWEAKMIGSSSLRSRTQEPKVLKQIDAYRSYLGDADRKQQVIEAYQQCCGIIRDLHDMASQIGTTHRLDPLISAAAKSDSQLAVEENPGLVIFDNGKKRNEEAWQKHIGVLRREVPVAIVEMDAIGNPLEELNAGLDP